MTPVEQVQQLMRELGPNLQVNSVYEHQALSWSVFFDDDIAGKELEVYLDHITQKEQLVFSADVMIPVSVNRLNIYKLLLQYNHAWREKDFAFTALSENGDYFTLITTIDVSKLNVNILAESLHRYYQLLMSWKCFVNSNASDLAIVNDKALMPTIDSHMLKV